MTKKQLLKKLGFRIKVLRTEAELTQSELAAKLSLSRASIAKLENGETNIGIGNLPRYTKALNCKLEDILKSLV